MPVAKFGCTDRSAKLACPACNTIFLTVIGIVADAAVGCALPAALLEATLPDAALPRGVAGTGAGAVAATGAPPGAGAATTVAPGPANTRFTFKLVSGSIM